MVYLFLKKKFYEGVITFLFHLLWFTPEIHSLFIRFDWKVISIYVYLLSVEEIPITGYCPGLNKTLTYTPIRSDKQKLFFP